MPVVVEAIGSRTGQIECSRRLSRSRWHRRQREFRVRNCTSPQCGQERTSRVSAIARGLSKILGFCRFPGSGQTDHFAGGATIEIMGELVSVRGKAVLFDMDGTLVDSTQVVECAWGAWAARHDIPFSGTRRACPFRGDANGRHPGSRWSRACFACAPGAESSLGSRNLRLEKAGRDPHHGCGLAVAHRDCADR